MQPRSAEDTVEQGDDPLAAESPQVLPEDLELLWRRDLPKPTPAFNDVRLQFDGGYEPIVAGQRLFLASNREDKVMAFDTNSGDLLWEFFTNGPVRLAPVAWKDRVLFGSDDGCFYSVDSATGSPQWSQEWSSRTFSPARRASTSRAPDLPSRGR